MKRINHEAYSRALSRAIKEVIEGGHQGITTGIEAHSIKIAFLGVKTIATAPPKKAFCQEEAISDFNQAEALLTLLGSLTPEQLQQVFPISKTYDGNRWEIKDYFSVMEYIRTLKPGAPISTSVDPFEFLWEYHNPDLRMFTVKFMGYMDNLRNSQGKPSMMEEWAGQHGISTYKLHTAPNGTEYMQESGTGRTFPVKKSSGSRLKLVKR